MAVLTQSRVRSDTFAPSKDIWGGKLLGLRPLGLCLLFAVFLHLPFIQSGWLNWMSILWSGWGEAPVDNGELVIPIELDTGLFEDEEVSPDGSNDGVAKSIGDAKEGEAVPVGGGAPTTPPTVAEPVEPPPPAPPPPAPLPPSVTPDPVPEGPVQDPNAAAGDIAEVNAGKANNVRIYLAADVMRSRPQARNFSRLLAGIPQWKELLGGTGISPIHHFDHILISGPQMRDPKDIIVTADFNFSEARMRNAIDAVVRRSKPEGRWLPHKDMPMAIIGSDGGRRAVIVPERKLLVVLPKQAEDRVELLREVKPFRKSTRAVIILYAVNPWRAFIGSPVDMPKRIKYLRLQLRILENDEYALEIDFKDVSAEAAEEDAEVIRRALAKFRVPLVGYYFFGDPKFEVDGDTIRASAPVTEAHLRRAISRIGSALEIDLE